MSEPRLVDITGRLRSPAATPGHWTGCVPPNKGPRYPADPPTVEEIILVMREAGVARVRRSNSRADGDPVALCPGWRSAHREMRLAGVDLADRKARLNVARHGADDDPRAFERRPACLHALNEHGHGVPALAPAMRRRAEGDPGRAALKSAHDRRGLHRRARR